MSSTVSNFDWNHIRAFLAVVQQGSLSGAARELGQTQPTLSRQISNLEAALQTTLFVRGTRETTLTDTGAALFEQVQNMADAASQISQIAAGRNETVEGTIRITATDAVVCYVLPRCLKVLRETHPGVHVELIPSSASTDLARHEADIAIRHVRPDQPDLIARRIGDFDVSLFASQEYLNSLGNPSQASDFASADFIGFEHAERLVEQVNGFGVPVTRDNFSLVATSGVVIYELARQGLGIALLPKTVAAAQFGLKEILPDLVRPQLPVWLVSHKDVQTKARIRLCFDLIAETLKDYLVQSSELTRNQ